MRIISPILKKVVYPSLSKAGLFRRLPAAGLAIVTYHGVLPDGYQSIDPALDGNLVTSENLRQQLRLLKERYNVVSPEDVRAWLAGKHELGPRAVLLTCDDGLLNCLTDMMPILQQEALSCLFFVTDASTGESRETLWYEELFLLFLRASAGPFEIDCEGLTIHGELLSAQSRRTLWWDSVKQLSRISEASRNCFLQAARSRLTSDSLPKVDMQSPLLRHRFGLMMASELCSLDSAGMAIGAHTLSHPMLSQAPPELAYFEIAESRARLQTLLKKQVWGFAYPFGDSQSVTPQVLAMPHDAGFSAAFLNFGGGLDVPLPQYALPRIHVTAAMRLSEFEAHISGFYAKLQRRGGRGMNAGTELATTSG